MFGIDWRIGTRLNHVYSFIHRLENQKEAIWYLEFYHVTFLLKKLLLVGCHLMIKKKKILVGKVEMSLEDW